MIRLLVLLIILAGIGDGIRLAANGSLGGAFVVFGGSVLLGFMILAIRVALLPETKNQGTTKAEHL